jgi:hypothetical protein
MATLSQAARRVGGRADGADEPDCAEGAVAYYWAIDYYVGE